MSAAFVNVRRAAVLAVFVTAFGLGACGDDEMSTPIVRCEPPGQPFKEAVASSLVESGSVVRSPIRASPLHDIDTPKKLPGLQKAAWIAAVKVRLGDKPTQILRFAVDKAAFDTGSGEIVPLDDLTRRTSRLGSEVRATAYASDYAKRAASSQSYASAEACVLADGD